MSPETPSFDSTSPESSSSDPGAEPVAGQPQTVTSTGVLDPDSPASGAFAPRHIGPDGAELDTMLAAIGVASVDELIGQTVPAEIALDAPLDLPPAINEHEALARLRNLADQNQMVTSLIGCGYHDTLTPAVIKRNVLESPAWYTAYTPYQPEISQGRLEALLNFQTMVSDLTGMEISNASLLDESTAAAEAMTLMHRVDRSDRHVMLVDSACHPQTIEVVRTRARPLGIEIRLTDGAALAEGNGVDDTVFGVLAQYPGTSGEVLDLTPIAEQAHAVGARLAVAADLLALVLLRSPGEAGADVVVGSTQRFGVPLGFGGPHAAFMATSEAHRRSLPGRLVGVSIDTEGRPALRLALQTREQHIRREKATSNICTAQVLLAVIAGLYACWHGPEGLRRIASRVHGLTTATAEALTGAGFTLSHSVYFDTLSVASGSRTDELIAAALDAGINLRRLDDERIGISFDETSTPELVATLLASFGVQDTLIEETLRSLPSSGAHPAADAAGGPGPDGELPDVLDGLLRTDDILAHEIFSAHRSETEMLRYLRRLSDLDIALDRSMIPLGSCTMKLNATTEMEPITWPEFASIHPFAPLSQAAGHLKVIEELETMLVEITGYDAVSLQPNAGSQGEFAGLLAIRSYHDANGDTDRTICLIPASAHGTNAASAVMAGMSVVVVACDEHGNVDRGALTAKLTEHSERLAAIMITYPSTHGVFETEIRSMCDEVHAHGGQVYLDGANLNAMVGVAKPGQFGADVSHLNLHKTFCIPHGGGGPGVGPIGVKSHLASHLPNHPLVAEAGPATGPGPISGAPWGSAGILAIPHTYIALMGPEGLRRATEVAIVSANYIATRLAPHFPVLYTGAHDRVAHECILDLRTITKTTGVSVDDVAKRLIDHGFHAPTMSFPVAGTLMVEPTESESLAELDRFCDAMVSIAGEIAKVSSGEWPADDNPLAHSPHTAEVVTADEWTRPYPRSIAAYPTLEVRRHKYWPPVGRIDAAYGDKNLNCSCIPISAYDDAASDSLADSGSDETAISSAEATGARA